MVTFQTIYLLRGLEADHLLLLRELEEGRGARAVASVAAWVPERVGDELENDHFIVVTHLLLLRGLATSYYHLLPQAPHFILPPLPTT